MMAGLLGAAVGPGSHFLPVTPIVTIGEHLPIQGMIPDFTTYIIHHEYLHYEQFTSCLLIQLTYVEQCLKLSGTLAGLHQFPAPLSTVAAMIDSQPLRFDSTAWDDRRVAADQSSAFRIGLSALLEGEAILDCFLKPPTSVIATVGVEVMEALFKHRNLQVNRHHIIGVESCLAAVGLGNQDFRDLTKLETLSSRRLVARSCYDSFGRTDFGSARCALHRFPIFRDPVGDRRRLEGIC